MLTCGNIRHESHICTYEQPHEGYVLYSTQQGANCQDFCILVQNLQYTGGVRHEMEWQTEATDCSIQKSHSVEQQEHESSKDLSFD